MPTQLQGGTQASERYH